MYILECANGMYYTGSTINLDNRLIDHSVWAGSKFTSDKLPVKLVYYEEFDRVEDAFNREHQIKKWSRKKKEALIKGDMKALKKAAKSKLKKEQGGDS
ncbi:MAG: GIY-YIG nuclease family protein [Bacteroidota bacterium]